MPVSNPSGPQQGSNTTTNPANQQTNQGSNPLGNIDSFEKNTMTHTTIIFRSSDGTQHVLICNTTPALVLDGVVVGSSISQSTSYLYLSIQNTPGCFKISTSNMSYTILDSTYAQAFYIAIDTNGNYVYSGVPGASAVSLFKTNTNSGTTIVNTTSIALGASGGGLTGYVSPDGKYYYVSGSSGVFANFTIAKIATSNLGLVGSITLGIVPFALFTSPDGNFLFTDGVNDNNNNPYLCIIDTQSMVDTTNGGILLPTSGTGMVCDPRGENVYISMGTNNASGSIMCVNVATQAITYFGQTSTIGVLTGGDVAVTQDNQFLIQSNTSTSHGPGAYIFNLATNTLAFYIAAPRGIGCHGNQIDADGVHFYFLEAAPTTSSGAIIYKAVISTGQIVGQTTAMRVAHSGNQAAYNFIAQNPALQIYNSYFKNQAVPNGNNAYFTPTNPTGTVSATAVMMGLGDIGSQTDPVIFTPGSTGKIKIMARCLCNVGTASTDMKIALNYGTGTPPVNGAAATGTAISSTENIQIGLTTAGSTPWAYVAVLNLGPTSIGNPYYFDFAVTSNGAATAETNNVSILIEEL